MEFDAVLDLAGRLPASLPPLVTDIDGTLTDDDRALDPRVVPVCRKWPAPLVLATGKSMPYAVALSEFLGIEPLVIAENGGVVLVGRTETLQILGDPDSVQAVLAAYREQGHETGWGRADLVNRWRETELAVSRESPLEPLSDLATSHGLMVVDSGYAYHVKSPDITKMTGLKTVATDLGIDPGRFAAVGDSANDAPLFADVGHAVAVANADDTAKAGADHVTDAGFADGFLETVERLVRHTDGATA